MGIIAWIVLGLIAGLIAKLIVPADTGGGCLEFIVIIVIGIVGAVIGGFIGTALGWGKVDAFDLRSIGLAIIGAIVLLLGLRALRSV